MAVDTEPRERHRASLPPVLVSRQPVIDVRDRITGYRISYAVLDGSGTASPVSELPAELLAAVIGVIGEEEQAAGSRAHLPVSREMLLGGGGLAVDPSRVLLRLDYVDAVDPALRGVLDRAIERGFELELDGLPAPEIDPATLSRFRAVEVDLSRFPLPDVAALVPQIRLRGTVALASGVQTHAERDEARALGFDWFTGPFFATPDLGSGNAISAGSIKALAAAMLGATGRSRRAMVAASLGDSEQIPREHALLALTRARACELLAADYSASVDPDEMFTIGLLSAVDVAFRIPLEKVVEGLALDERTAEALLQHTGPAGAVLGSVIHYEQGRYLAPGVRASLLANADAYREALVWAREAICEMS
jgi:c-di-GMP-related signal transduction protein